MYNVICYACTKFCYSYEDEPNIENYFKLGTCHYINLRKDGDKYIIRLHDGEVIEDTTLIDSAKEYKSPVNNNQKPHLPIKLLGKISIKYILSRPVISLFMIILTYNQGGLFYG